MCPTSQICCKALVTASLWHQLTDEAFRESVRANTDLRQETSRGYLQAISGPNCMPASKFASFMVQATSSGLILHLIFCCAAILHIADVQIFSETVENSKDAANAHHLLRQSYGHEDSDCAYHHAPLTEGRMPYGKPQG